MPWSVRKSPRSTVTLHPQCGACARVQEPLTHLQSRFPWAPWHTGSNPLGLSKGLGLWDHRKGRLISLLLIWASHFQSVLNLANFAASPSRSWQVWISHGGLFHQFCFVSWHMLKFQPIKKEGYLQGNFWERFLTLKRDLRDSLLHV